MRSEALANAITHARTPHGDWTDASHDLALGQMSVAHQPYPFTPSPTFARSSMARSAADRSGLSNPCAGQSV